MYDLLSNHLTKCLVGKTVLLRQLRSETPDALYVSVDTLERDTSLIDLVRMFQENYRITVFFIDEIHFLRGFEGDLKELYDFYSVNIWFTSPSSLSIYGSAWDLSRRVNIERLHPFSLREYLFFCDQGLLETLTIKQTLSSAIGANYLRQSYRFKDYVSGGLYPFTLEPGAGLDQFGDILQKVIRSDIPACEPQTTFDDLSEIEKMVEFVGRSQIDGINYTSLSSNLGITKYKAEKFVDLLERSFIMRKALPAGTNVLKEPKIFMEPPYRLLFRDYKECIGELREDFFALCMEQHNTSFQYAKSTRGAKTPDFVVILNDRPVVIEVGGRGKGRSRFKGLEYDRKVVLYQGEEGRYEPRRQVPLHCLGFA